MLTVLRGLAWPYRVLARVTLWLAGMGAVASALWAVLVDGSVAWALILGAGAGLLWEARRQVG